MFERFSEPARQAVVLAQEEARELRHSSIGTEHLLLGLLREKQGLAARALEILGITVERVRAEVVAIVAPGEESRSGQIPFTPRAKKVLELALREALSLGHDWIGTEHILLGLVREGEGVEPDSGGLARRILLEKGIDAKKVRNQVLPMLTDPSGRIRGARADERPGRPPATPLDWRGATLLWRPEGLELRVPLHLWPGAMAAFAADEVWSTAPLAGLRREIWRGWLALASPALLDDVDPDALREALDGAAQRAADGGRREGAEEFLRRLRGDPPRAR